METQDKLTPLKRKYICDGNMSLINTGIPKANKKGNSLRNPHPRSRSIQNQKQPPEEFF